MSLETIKQEACGLVLSDMYLSLPVDHFSPPEEEPHFTPTHTQQKSKKKKKKKTHLAHKPPQPFITLLGTIRKRTCKMERYGPESESDIYITPSILDRVE